MPLTCAEVLRLVARLEDLGSETAALSSAEVDTEPEAGAELGDEDLEEAEELMSTMSLWS